MTDVITFIYNNIKPSVYTGGNIHELYCYLEMIGYPTTLNTSDQKSYYFGSSSSINKDTEFFQPVIAALHMRQKSFWKCCGRIGNKADAYIICGPKFLPPSLIRKMNKCNSLHGEEPSETPREWNSQHPVSHLYGGNTVFLMRT